MPIPAYMIGKDLIAALGLPKYTVGFTLRCRADELVTVECEYLPDDAPGLIASLAQYTLEQIPDAGKSGHSEHPAAAMGFEKWMRQRTERAHAEFMGRTGAL